MRCRQSRRRRRRRSLLTPSGLLVLSGLLAGLVVTPAGCLESRMKPIARPRPPPPPRPLAGLWHRVVAGETAARIAQHYRVEIQDVEEINGVDRRDALTAGRLLFVPHGQHPTARRSHASRKEKSPGAKNDPVQKGPAGASSSQRLRWPVPKGILTSAFGRRGKRVHEGIDIGAPRGSAVIAAAAGQVIYAGSGIKGYGNMMIVRHDKDLVTVYAHNRRNLARDGQRVAAGEVIAEVGKSGRATGFHLHFELRRGDKPVNPLRYVRGPDLASKGRRGAARVGRTSARSRR